MDKNTIDQARIVAVQSLICSADEAATLLEAIATTIPAGRPLHREVLALVLELRGNASICRRLNV